MRPICRARRSRARRRALARATLAVLGVLGLVAAGGTATAAMPGGGEPMPGMDAGGRWRPMLFGEMPDRPDVVAASARQRARAWTLLRRARRLARRFDTPARARRMGFAARGHADAQGLEHYDWHGSRRHRAGRVLDPRRPDSLLFWHRSDGRMQLAAEMFRAPSGRRPPTPGGPITRWHAHYSCVPPDPRDPRQKPSGRCVDGRVAHYGATVMLHVWFTDELDTAFAMLPPLDALIAP